MVVCALHDSGWSKSFRGLCPISVSAAHVGFGTRCLEFLLFGACFVFIAGFACSFDWFLLCDSGVNHGFFCCCDSMSLWVYLEPHCHFGDALLRALLLPSVLPVGVARWTSWKVANSSCCVRVSYARWPGDKLGACLCDRSYACIICVMRLEELEDAGLEELEFLGREYAYFEQLQAFGCSAGSDWHEGSSNTVEGGSAPRLASTVLRTARTLRALFFLACGSGSSFHNLPCVL